MQTVEEALTYAMPNNLPDALRCIDIGAFFRGSIPQWISYTGLSSAASHVLNAATDGSGETQPGVILAVTDGSNAPLAMVPAGVGAGEVQVAYDSECVPTLTFSGAVTAFKVLVMTRGKGKDSLGFGSNLDRNI